MKTKAPICESCTEKKLHEYIGAHAGLYFQVYLPIDTSFAQHERLHRNDKWYKGVTPVYMKRVYIRETTKNKQRLREYGYVCLQCDRVIVTMRKNVKMPSNYVGIVRK